MPTSQSSENQSQTGMKVLAGVIGFIVGTVAVLWALYRLMFP